MDLDSELKIEREWRQQLELSSRQDRETLAKQKLDIGYLEKVAGVRRPCFYCDQFFPNGALKSAR